MDKVRLTQEDIANGNIDRATDRMNTGDGGLAKHSTTCEQPINWEGAKIVGRESKMTQRKFLEGVITLKERGKGRIPLNAYNPGNPWYSSMWGPERKNHCVCHLRDISHGGGAYPKLSIQVLFFFFI